MTAFPKECYDCYTLKNKKEGDRLPRLVNNKIKITQEAFDSLYKTFVGNYEIISDTNTVVTPINKYMNIENKKRTATKRSDGRYVASFTDENGKRKYKYGKTAEEAINKAIQAEKDILDKKANENYSFQSCYKKWFIFKCLQAKNEIIDFSTVDRIERTYNKYYKDTEFSRTDVRIMTEASIVDFLSKIINSENGTTHKNWAKIFQIVRDSLIYMYDQAVLKREQFISFNWTTIKRTIEGQCKLNIKAKKQTVITANEKQSLHQSIENNIRPQKPVSSLAILANEDIGARRGELVALTWKDIDFTKELIYINSAENQHFERDENGERVGTTVYSMTDPKTKRSKRKIPMTQKVKKILLTIKQIQISKGWYSDNQYVVYDGIDYKSRSREYGYDLYAMCRDSELRSIPNHLFRKSLATELSSAGVAPNIIRDMLGHVDYSTTEEFYILDSEVEEMRTQLKLARDKKAS